MLTYCRVLVGPRRRLGTRAYACMQLVYDGTSRLHYKYNTLPLVVLLLDVCFFVL